MSEVNVRNKLALDTFKVGKETHLKVSQALCRNCDQRPCLKICPAQVYSIGPQGEVRAEYEACLECGTCLIACPHGAIDWNYPAGGCGVQFRYG